MIPSIQYNNQTAALCVYNYNIVILYVIYCERSVLQVQYNTVIPGNQFTPLYVDKSQHFTFNLLNTHNYLTRRLRQRCAGESVVVLFAVHRCS